MLILLEIQIEEKRVLIGQEDRFNACVLKETKQMMPSGLPERSQF